MPNNSNNNHIQNTFHRHAFPDELEENHDNKEYTLETLELTKFHHHLLSDGR